MPARLRATYDVSPEAMRVTFRARQWGLTAFLTLWLTMWTVGCVVLAHEVIVKQQLFLILFGIPFWAAWFFVAAVLLASITRRQELVVDSQGLRYVDRAIIRLKNRWIPRDEFRGFDVVERPVRRNNSNAQVQTGLEIRAAGKPLFIFAGLPDDELHWLAHQLSQLVDALPGQTAPSDAEIAGISTTAASATYPQSLTLSREEVEPPSDCSWQRLSDFGALTFVQFGRWSWGGVLGMLFISAFWNGIVGLFVLQLFGMAPVHAPQGTEWWFLLLFLIPFELIGLAMVVGLLFTILEPARQRVWRFDANQIECRWSWLGIGPRWTYRVESLGRIDLVRAKIGRKSGNQVQLPSGGAWSQDGSRFGLSLVRPDNIQLCQIKPLTEGEARWIADKVMRERPEWFR